VAREDRLEAELAGHRVDRARVLEEPPGRDRPVFEDHARRQRVGVEMPLAMAALRLGVGLDDDGRVGVVLPRPGEHLGETVGIGPAKADRGVAPGLVDHEDEARIGRVERWIDGAVFPQMRLRHACHNIPRTVQKRRVVKGMAGKERFQVGRAGGVEIHPRPVYHEADRRLPGAAGMERPEKGVLHADNCRAGALGRRLAPRRVGGMAPDQHVVGGIRPAEAQVVACQRQDAPHPALGQEPRVEVKARAP
jgi:hypothetical protein